jgi:leucyl aminopeptidase (aminopeptidase T)
VNEAEEKFLRLTKEELHYALQIELDEFYKDEDENAESMLTKGPEPEEKRTKFSIAKGKTQKKKVKKRKNDEADKENALPKPKKTKKAEKQKRKQKVYLIAVTVNSTAYEVYSACFIYSSVRSL